MRKCVYDLKKVMWNIKHMIEGLSKELSTFNFIFLIVLDDIIEINLDNNFNFSQNINILV